MRQQSQEIVAAFQGRPEVTAAQAKQEFAEFQQSQGFAVIHREQEAAAVLAQVIVGTKELKSFEAQQGQGLAAT